MNAPKMIFKNNTWPHLSKAVLGKAVKRTRKHCLLFHRLKARRYNQNSASKTIFPRYLLNIYLIVDEKAKTVHLSSRVSSGLASFLFACSCSHRCSARKVNICLKKVVLKPSQTRWLSNVIRRLDQQRHLTWLMT